ncbi:hypothetical protein [Sphaerimonospora thailandensis]|uniref:Uncharacterized protein n=1 Tax=Sphaerimonospora thailandensis TaxID=795644 RepID=A0A8J3VZQ7_9ACTN|nr:hypothetical protein [Sphaerimonospora thailandensis]GIH70355.1 hypothetical protein Mth01_26080 [Sphaerimonospora thailandensis]
MTGIPAVDVFMIIGIVGGALTLVWKGLRFGMRIYRRIEKFLDDWQGEPARPGVEARPGFPERIAALEAESAEVKRIVSNGLSHTVADIQERMTRFEERLNGGT